jgi:pterin-4a-carbinolamine dehydratase
MNEDTLITPIPPQKEPPVPVVDKLKAERVEYQLSLTPGWHLAPEGTAIQRQFQFEQPGQALAFAGLIYGLTARWQHRPEVRIAHANTVTCLLTSPESGGLTARDFQVARRLSQQA